MQSFEQMLGRGIGASIGAQTRGTASLADALQLPVRVSGSGSPCAHQQQRVSNASTIAFQPSQIGLWAKEELQAGWLQQQREQRAPQPHQARDVLHSVYGMQYGATQPGTSSNNANDTGAGAAMGAGFTAAGGSAADPAVVQIVQQCRRMVHGSLEDLAGLRWVLLSGLCARCTRCTPKQ